MIVQEIGGFGTQIFEHEIAIEGDRETNTGL
jgi:hypothetical protein